MISSIPKRPNFVRRLIEKKRHFRKLRKRRGRKKPSKLMRNESRRSALGRHIAKKLASRKNSPGNIGPNKRSDFVCKKPRRKHLLKQNPRKFNRPRSKLIASFFVNVSWDNSL